MRLKKLKIIKIILDLQRIILYSDSTMKKLSKIFINKLQYEVATGRLSLDPGDVARVLGCTKAYVSMLASGKCPISAAEKRKKLMLLLNCGFDDIFLIKVLDK